jgi:hypothetical protein
MHLGVHIKSVNKHDDGDDNDGVINQDLFPARGALMEQPGHRYEQNAHKSDRQQSQDGIYQ